MRLSSSRAPYMPVASRSTATTPPVDPVLLAHEVRAQLRVGNTTLHNLLKSGELEAPFRVTARIRAWRQSTIDAFIASKEAK